MLRYLEFFSSLTDIPSTLGLTSPLLFHLLQDPFILLIHPIVVLEEINVASILVALIVLPNKQFRIMHRKGNPEVGIDGFVFLTLLLLLQQVDIRIPFMTVLDLHGKHHGPITHLDSDTDSLNGRVETLHNYVWFASRLRFSVARGS